MSRRRIILVAATFLAAIALVYAAVLPFVSQREKECEAKCQARGHKSYAYQGFSGSFRRPEADRCTCL